MTIDLSPAASRVAGLVASVPDGLLAAPTPCPDYSLGDLLDHIGGLALAFTAAARQDFPSGITTQPPAPSGSQLAPDWREAFPRRLAAMAEAWRDPSAWAGMTQAGGVDLPGEDAGIVALDELVLHGWDLARATGQPYEVDEPSLDAVHGFVQQFSGPGQEAARAGLFGPVVDVPADAPLLDRVLGLAGRDPGWTSPG